MDKQTLSEKIQRMANGIHGALSNEEILKKLKEYGYTPEKIGEGEKILDRVNELVNKQVKEYGDQYTFSGNILNLFKACYSRYMILIKLLRIALKNETGKLYSLRATGSRNHSYSGWLKDARILYNNLLNDAESLEKLDAFGIRSERIKDEFSQVEAFEMVYIARLKEIGEAQQATQDRDAAIDMLSQWYSDFRAVARIALYDSPQLLEGLGIVVKR
jgi:hypothetical protein